MQTYVIYAYIIVICVYTCVYTYIYIYIHIYVLSFLRSLICTARSTTFDAFVLEGRIFFGPWRRELRKPGF